MEWKDRIRIDAGELTLRIDRALDQLKPFQYDSKYRDLLGSNLIEKLNAWDRKIRERRSDPFTMVICGDFKRGKSSLINALLGEDVVTTNVTTETVTLNRIAYGPHANEAVLPDGRMLTLLDSELSCEAMNRLWEESGQPFKHLELKREIELLKNVTIIDTPGLGDSLRDFSEDVAGALQQADAVAYIFSCMYPLSMSEQLYLRSTILPQKYTSLFLVGNFADMAGNEKDYERLRGLLENKSGSLLPGTQIYMVSALDERCRQLGEERPSGELADTLAGNFNRFREDVTKMVEDKKDIVLPDRMQRMLSMMSEDVLDDLAVLERGLEMSDQDASAAMEALSGQKAQQASVQAEAVKTIDSVVQSMRDEATVWVSGCLDRLKEDTKTLGQYSAEDLSRYYSFFCIETIQEAVSCCVDRHMMQLYDEMEKISSDLSRALTQNREEAGYRFSFTLDTRTWTRGDNVGFAVSVFSSGLLSLVADGIGGAMRKRELKDRRQDLIDAIVRQHDTFYVSVQKTLEETYQKMGNQAKKLLMEYFRDSVERLERQTEEAVTAARQDSGRKEEIRGAIRELKETLAKTDIIRS